jgi:O-methyltransferase involved in polyketide biosynthesis
MAENIEADLRIGATARWAAAVRAAESSREDGLFNDPWAAALAGSEGMEWLAGVRADLTQPWSETLLASGFDSRAP